MANELLETLQNVSSDTALAILAFAVTVFTAVFLCESLALLWEE